MEAVMPKRHRVKPNSYHGAEEGGLRQSLLEMGVIQDLDKVRSFSDPDVRKHQEETQPIRSQYRPGALHSRRGRTPADRALHRGAYLAVPQAEERKQIE